MSVTVFKNTIWLVLPQLLLNALSVFAIAYMARILGKEDYGKYIFTFAFVGVFSPFINMGLRAVTVREIARGCDHEETFIGKIISIQLIHALICVVVAVITINLMGCPSDTKSLVYVATLTILFYAVFTTLQDVFQAHEKMKYVAHSQFIGGLGMTVFSVAVLFFGSRLMGVTIASVLGVLLALTVGSVYYLKLFPIPRFGLDFHFWRANLKRAAPFFILALVSTVGNRISVVMLSSMAGDAAVGLYGAANNLIEKLMIIPDGVCTAFFPTMIILYKQSAEDAAALFKRVLLYLVLLGLPIATGTAILARPIILMIYGSKYIDAVPVLQILAGWVFVSFVISLQGWTMGAIHQEKKAALASFITAPLCIVLNFALIPFFQEIGTGLAALISACVSFFVLRFYLRRHLTAKMTDMFQLAKVVVANLVMGGTAYLLKDFYLLIPVAVSIVVYAVALWFLRIFTSVEIENFKSLLSQRLGIPRHSGGAVS